MSNFFASLRAYIALRPLWTYDGVDDLYWRGSWTIEEKRHRDTWYRWELAGAGDYRSWHESLTAAMRAASVEDVNENDRLRADVEKWRSEAHRWEGAAQALEEEVPNLQLDRNNLQRELDAMRRLYAESVQEQKRDHANMRSMANGLVLANQVLHFDLKRMIEDGPDYNQAVKDAAEATFTALLDTPSFIFADQDKPATSPKQAAMEAQIAVRQEKVAAQRGEPAQDKPWAPSPVGLILEQQRRNG